MRVLTVLRAVGIARMMIIATPAGYGAIPRGFGMILGLTHGGGRGGGVHGGGLDGDRRGHGDLAGDGAWVGQSCPVGIIRPAGDGAIMRAIGDLYIMLDLYGMIEDGLLLRLALLTTCRGLIPLLAAPQYTRLHAAAPWAGRLPLRVVQRRQRLVRLPHRR